MKAQAAPDPQERRDHDPEGEEPEGDDHDVEVTAPVHTVVDTVMADQDVPTLVVFILLLSSNIIFTIITIYIIIFFIIYY